MLVSANADEPKWIKGNVGEVTQADCAAETLIRFLLLRERLLTVARELARTCSVHLWGVCVGGCRTREQKLFWSSSF